MSLFSFLRRDGPPHVEPLATSDAGEAAAIHAAGFARGWDLMDMQAMIADRAIRADGLFVGTGRRLTGILLSRTVLDEAEILTVALAPSARGRGWSGLLLREHLAGLAAAGIRTVFLEVEEDNAPAIALYRRHGFTPIGRREAYYPRPGGRHAAALTMRRALD